MPARRGSQYGCDGPACELQARYRARRPRPRLLPCATPGRDTSHRVQHQSRVLVRMIETCHVLLFTSQNVMGYSGTPVKKRYPGEGIPLDWRAHCRSSEQTAVVATLVTRYRTLLVADHLSLLLYTPLMNY